MCSKLNYAIFSQNRYEVLYLTVKDESLTTVQNDFNAQGNDHDIWIYHQYGYVTQVLLDTPPLINVTLLPCPPGFTLLGDPPGCDCNPVLTNFNNKFSCHINKGKGYFSWSGYMWLSINVANAELYLAQ